MTDHPSPCALGHGVLLHHSRHVFPCAMKDIPFGVDTSTPLPLTEELRGVTATGLRVPLGGEGGEDWFTRSAPWLVRKPFELRVQGHLPISGLSLGVLHLKVRDALL